MSDASTPLPAASRWFVVGWGALSVGLGAAVVGWLTPDLPEDPLLVVPWPAVPAESGTATDPPGRRSQASLRAAAAALVVTSTEAGPTPGYDLRIAAGATEATLVDLGGRVLHRWSARRDTYGAPGSDQPRFGTFRAARLREDGGLFVLVDGVGLVAADRDGTQEWVRVRDAHDHLERLPSGNVRVLTTHLVRLPEVERTESWELDQVVEVDPAGTVVARVDLWKVYRATSLDWRPARGDRAPPLGAVWFETDDEGLLHVALRRRGAVAVIDPETSTLVREDRWPDTEVGAFVGLPDGTTVLADHHPDRAGLRLHYGDRSGVVLRTLDLPLDPGRLALAALQRLENGHLLVTAGGVRELAPDGAVVWSVDSPDPVPLVLSQNLRYPLDCCAWVDPGAAP